MQPPASVPTDQFPDLLQRLPAGLDLDQLALETKAIRRKRKIGDGASLLRLALARGPGGFSLRQAAGWVSLLGIAELSNPGVHYRLKQAVAFLAALLGRLLAAKVPGGDLRWPGRTLRLADGTCVSKPGSTGTDWRVHGVFDLGSGGFSHLELTDQHGAEALERGAPLAGEIRIGDRNYARVPVLKRFLAERGGKADFIVRVGWNALQLTTLRGKAFDLIGHLQRLPSGIGPHDVSLRASAGRGEAALPVRLIVQRKTPEATRLAPRRDQEGQETRPAQPDRRGVHDRCDVVAEARLHGEGCPRRIPVALANRTCVQAPEIAAAYRPTANADRAGIAKLAVRPPHSRSAV
jgi:hypothetical protein